MKTSPNHYLINHLQSNANPINGCLLLRKRLGFPFPSGYPSKTGEYLRSQSKVETWTQGKSSSNLSLNPIAIKRPNFIDFPTPRTPANQPSCAPRSQPQEMFISRTAFRRPTFKLTRNWTLTSDTEWVFFLLMLTVNSILSHQLRRYSVDRKTKVVAWSPTIQRIRIYQDAHKNFRFLP